jgi:hypothetical protein
VETPRKLNFPAEGRLECSPDSISFAGDAGRLPSAVLVTLTVDARCPSWRFAGAATTRGTASRSFTCKCSRSPAPRTPAGSARSADVPSP